MLVHLPVGLFTLYFVDFIGLKKTFWISTSLNVIGTGLRLGRASKRLLLDRALRNFLHQSDTPILATAFHDGSNYESCHKNQSIADVEYSNWYCPSPGWGYPVALLGMVITSIAMGLRSGLPTKVTAQWFKPKEYDIANTFASLADPLGTMITCLLAPFVAKEPSDLWYLQVYISIPVCLSFIGSLFIRQEGYENEINKQSFKVLVVVMRRNF